MIIMQRSMFYSFVLSIVWKYGNGPALRGSSIPGVHLGLGWWLGLGLGLGFIVRVIVRGLGLWQGCSHVVSVLNVSVLRRSRDVFFRTSRLVSVSRVWKNRTSRSRLGLEDITSRSRSRDFSLENMRAMHEACGYIMKKIMDLTRKKQFVKWQTSRVGVFKLQHCGLETFFGTSRSRVSVSRRSRDVFWNVSSRLGLEGSTSRSRLGLVT